MKVMLFGGSFNPPHLGHQQMLKSVLEIGLVDQVWYLPVGKHDFDKSVVSADRRLEMLELISPKLGEDFFKQVKIEDCEVRYFQTSYTATTLDYLSARYPQHQFSFLMGSDNLAKFHLWHDQLGRDYHYLLNNYQIYVYPREGFPLKPLYENMVPLSQLKPIAVSSTQVRELLKTSNNRDDLVKLLDQKIIKYIAKHNLYASS
jgi:nicotinate-nucleotide adenylyltransferase